MKNKRKIIVVLILLLVLFLFSLFLNKSSKTSTALVVSPTVVPTREEVQEIRLIEEELKSYYSSYQNPFVLHIRKVLNSYLQEEIEGISSPNVVVKANVDKDGLVTGLDSFSKDYYKSKFIVASITNFLGGGKEIEIQFQDKPDKIFGAWVYKLADGSYDLRGFWQHPISQGGLNELNRKHKMFLEDKEHAL